MSTRVPFAHPQDEPVVAGPAVDGPAAALPPRMTWWRRHHAVLALLAITLFGGALRFTALDRPSLWGDEAATYRRICGTYRQMLEVLRDAWFPPLHYELYWWLSRHVPVDPFGMRLVPAIAGTLMVPAMYFLARQMVGVRVSLTTATFTACSAFLLVYSRDGKMYMHFWLAVVLSTACLLWWARTSRATAWLGWVAAGLAMVGLHGMGFAVLALHVPFFLTARRVTGLKAIALVVGLAIIGAGDAVHYGAFNVVADQIQRAGWGASGIDWADQRNQGQPTALIVADSTAAFLFSFLWIQEPNRGEVVERVPEMMAWVLGILLALFTLGAMPWPRRWVAPVRWARRRSTETGPTPGNRFTRLVRRFKRPATVDGLPLARFDDAALAGEQRTLESPWRAALWLGMWLVLPAYAFHCASTDPPVAPTEWVEAVLSLADGRWAVLVGCVVAACALTQLSRHVPRFMGLGVAGVVAWTLFVALVRPDPLLAELDWPSRWGAGLTEPPILGGLLAATVAIWFNRAGATVTARLAGAAQFVLVAGALLLACVMLHRGIEGYFAERGYVLGREGNGSGAGRKSIWMPRWLAVVWPPLAIVVSALLMNLPTRPLRWLAVTFLLVVNLAQFTARLTAGTEGPHARVAADIIAGQGNGPVRTYTQAEHGGASPGSASIFDVAGRYYLYRAANRQPSPNEFLRNSIMNDLQVRRNVSPSRIAADVKASPNVNRLIVWTDHPPLSEIPDDGLAKQLGPEWRPAGDEVHHVRSFWNWAEFYQYHRREFERVGPS